MKFIKITLGLLFALLIVAVVSLISVLDHFNAIVKETVETVGQQVTQSHTRLEAVDTSLINGQIVLTGLSVSNPTGFDARYPILAVQRMVLSVDLTTLMSKVKVIKVIDIEGVEITVEHRNIRDTNVQAMINNIKRSSKAAAYPAKESNAVAEGAQPQETRLMIEKLAFANSSAPLVTEQWGSHSVELPAFSKNNIGDKTTGLTPEQVGDEILSAYMLHVREQVKDSLKELAKAKLEEKLEKKVGRKLEQFRDSIRRSIGIDK